MSPLVRLNWVSLSVVGTFSKPWVVQLSFVLAPIKFIPLFSLESDGNTLAKLFTVDGIKVNSDNMWILSVVLSLYFNIQVSVWNYLQYILDKASINK